MTTNAENRLYGVALGALLATAAGELFSIPPLITAGVAGFVLAVLALFALSSVVLAVSVARTPEVTALDSTVTDRAS